MTRPKKLLWQSKIAWWSRKTKIFIAVIVVMAIIVTIVVVFVKARLGQKQVVVQGVSTGLSSDDLNYSRVLVFLSQKNLTPQSVKIENGIMSFKIAETQVVLGLGNDLDGRLQTLWQVWHDYQVKGKTLKKIDLRFSYPLVLY